MRVRLYGKIIEGKCGDFYLESGDIMLMFSRWERGIATLSLWRDCHYLCEVLDKDAFYKAWREMKCSGGYSE